MNFENKPNKEESVQLLNDLVARQTTLAPRKVDKSIVLYGAGDLGQMAKKYFEKIGVKVEFIVDIRADIWREKECWKGAQVLFPEEVSVEQKNTHLLAVCIVKIPYIPLIDNLSNNGWRDIVPFYDIAEAYREYHPLSNGWFANLIDSADILKISSVLNMWSDDISRAHHLQFIAWRLLREEWVFENADINTENRFFIPEVVDLLSDHESFADIGAHHGKVTKKFIETVSNNFKKIWMVEPDSLNLQILNDYFSQIEQPDKKKIHILPRVVSDKSGTSKFYEGLGYASQLSCLGSTDVDLTTIDDLDISPTFIKLHLEGDELAALKGAEKTIFKYRPIIVFTTYHNDDGIWKLPIWIMRNFTNYQFYMRLHAWCGNGSVLYAIPLHIDISVK
jgi:FkbM family methyltransferase